MTGYDHTKIGRLNTMANGEDKATCARETCGCPPAQDSKYCGEECEDAAKVSMMEIGCTCRHPECD